MFGGTWDVGRRINIFTNMTRGMHMHNVINIHYNTICTSNINLTNATNRHGSDGCCRWYTATNPPTHRRSSGGFVFGQDAALE